jgi:hypothetical protein
MVLRKNKDGTFTPFRRKIDIQGGGGPILLNKINETRFPEIKEKEFNGGGGELSFRRIGNNVGKMHSVKPFNGGSIPSLQKIKMPTSLLKKKEKNRNNIRLDLN